MIVNFYYSHVDKSVNDMMIVYRRMAERLDFYKNSGVEVSLINVTTVSLEELSRLSSLADVNIVDATVRNIVTHEFGKVPDIQSSGRVSPKSTMFLLMKFLSILMRVKFY